MEVTNGETKQVSTTQYIEDETVAVAHNVEVIDQFAQYFSQSSSSESDSIIRYLSKPCEMQVGQFSIGDLATTFATTKYPYDFMSKTMYHRKIQGFLGFRGTLVLRLQVNAERFQQGRYMLCAVPMGGFTSENKAVDYFNRHAHFLVQRSQLPHAEIDIATQTACELRLPYAMAYDFYSFQLMPDVFKDIEYYVKIFPYQRLATGTGGNTAKYTLWAHYENIELIGQALPVELQSGRAAVKSSAKGKTNYSEKEAERAGVGPVQSMATKISKAASYLNAVPFINEFSAPVKWAADITANVASVFGWSAPANLEPQHRFKITNAQYATNVNKVDMSLPLSLDVGAAVVAKPEGPVAEDEMDIAYLASILSWQNTYAWPASSAEDTQIARLAVGLWPIGTPSTTIHGAESFRNLSPAQFVGTMFANWRGSVVFRFKFVKTEFHSGRLSFEFNPETRDYITPIGGITDDLAPYVYREVVDIRNLTELTLEIPYICNAPYLTTDWENTQTNKFGTLDIRVIDPLVAPDAASQTIYMIVEAALGKDAEFAVFANLLKITAPEFQLQSGEFKVLGGMTRRKAQVETACLAMGEKITNLRTLVKRFVPYVKTPDAGAVCTIAPFSSYVCPFAGGFVSFTANPDLYSALCQIYAFSRGGVRLKISSRNNAIGPVIIKLYHCTEGYDVEDVVVNSNIPEPNIWTSDYNFMNYANYVIENLSDFKMAEVSVPQYGKVHSRPSVSYSTGVNYPMTRSQRGLTSNTFVQVGAFNPDLTAAGLGEAASVKIDVMRAGAEDTNFSYFVSIPPYAIYKYTGVPVPP